MFLLYRKAIMAMSNKAIPPTSYLKPLTAVQCHQDPDWSHVVFAGPGWLDGPPMSANLFLYAAIGLNFRFLGLYF